VFIPEILKDTYDPRKWADADRDTLTNIQVWTGTRENR